MTMDIHTDAARQMQAHYREGLKAALSGSSGRFDYQAAQQARYGNFHAIHFRTFENRSYAADMDKVGEARAAAGHALGLNLVEAVTILGTPSKSIALLSEWLDIPVAQIRADVKSMDNVAQMAAVFMELSTALKEPKEPHLVTPRPDLAQIRRTLKSTELFGDDLEKLDAKGLLECAQTGIAAEQIKLSLRARKPELVRQAGIYGARAEAV